MPKNTMQSRISPACILVSGNCDLMDTLGIGSSTYIDRYGEFLNILTEQIKEMFSEMRIITFERSFGIDAEQKRCVQLRGLEMLWRELVKQNQNENKLSLHDNLQIFPSFKRWLKMAFWKSNKITVPEETWSHSFVSTRSTEDHGWFDRGFHELGHQNMGYTGRCLTAEIKLGNVRFDKVSSIGSGEYSQINKVVVLGRRTCSFNHGVFNQKLGENIEKTWYPERIAGQEQFSLISSVDCTVRLVRGTVL